VASLNAERPELSVLVRGAAPLRTMLVFFVVARHLPDCARRLNPGIASLEQRAIKAASLKPPE